MYPWFFNHPSRVLITDHLGSSFPGTFSWSESHLVDSLHSSGIVKTSNNIKYMGIIIKLIDVGWIGDIGDWQWFHPYPRMDWLKSTKLFPFFMGNSRFNMPQKPTCCGVMALRPSSVLARANFRKNLWMAWFLRSSQSRRTILKLNVRAQIKTVLQ